MEVAVQTENPTPIFKKSVRGFNWSLKEYDQHISLALSQKFELPEIISRLLAIRGVGLEEAEDFLAPSLKTSLPDPSHLLDMDKATDRIFKAVKEKENIVVFGDYDVDGATSSALLTRFFKMVGVEIKTYIPDRISEGYGPNTEALLKLKSEGADLIITVDCGTVSFDPLAEASKAGLDVIVIDHHLGSEKLPEAVAVVNPNRIDETSNHRNLAAVGLSFLLAVALKRKLREEGWFESIEEPDLLKLLDLVALGTICDVMTLTGLNRAYVSQGLKVMAKRRNLGLTVLSDVSRIDSAPEVYHAGFILGPRINAGGRIGKASLGTELLTTNDKFNAENISIELDKLNKERQALESMVLEEALIQAEKLPEDSSVIIVASENWHPGVIGIVASRLKDKFRRPAIVISLENGVGKASARSVNGADIGAAITTARTMDILEAGGGHEMAAGFTVLEEKIESLIEFLNSRLKDSVDSYVNNKQFYFDSSLTLGSVNLDLAKSLEKVGPFGPGNSEPRFIIESVKVIKSDVVGKDHVRCILADAGPFADSKKTIKAMAFSSLDTPIGAALLSNRGQEMHIAAKIKLNRWQGVESAELIIDDVTFA